MDDVAGDPPLPPARAAPRAEPSQTERMLLWICLVAAAGLGVILLGSASASTGWAAIRFATVGWLVALVALAVGGGLGLLFGFPVGGKVVVVRDGSADGGGGSERTGGDDWYGDNNAMEQVVDWLTKIIVGLGLVEATAIMQAFDRLALAASLAMGVRGAGSAEAAEVVGGTILLAYLVLGFAGVFLWARLYLKAEYTSERSRRLAAQVAALRQEVARTRQASQEERIDADRKIVDLSAAAGTKQQEAKDDSAGEQAREAVEKVTAAGVPEAGLESAGPVFPAPIQPGRHADDPWLGQFGGRARGGGAVLTATVAPLRTDAALFGVSLALAGEDVAARRALAGQEVRLYLHPTFPDPVRMLRFDARGEIRLPLVAYGAFTVGAQLCDGTPLELDLAALPDAPPLFRTR